MFFSSCFAVFGWNSDKFRVLNTFIVNYHWKFHAVVTKIMTFGQFVILKEKLITHPPLLVILEQSSFFFLVILSHNQIAIGSKIKKGAKTFKIFRTRRSSCEFFRLASWIGFFFCGQYADCVFCLQIFEIGIQD